MAGARSTVRYSSFSCEAVLHGQSWARDPPLASTVALPLLAAPRADAPGKSSGTGDTVVPIVPRTRRLRWRLAGAEHTEDSTPLAQTPSKHRSTTSSPQTKHQPALSADTTFPANAQLRPSASRVATTLDAQPPGPRALFDCLTITQMATTDTVVCYRDSELGEKRSNTTTVQGKNHDPARH